MVLHFMMSFELMHNGKTVKRYLECKELNFQSDGYFYYDPDRKEIALLQLGSNGNFSVGNVKAENGTILQYGYSISPNSKLEYKNPLEMTADGKLIDKFFSFEKGEWRAGHSRVYKAKYEALLFKTAKVDPTLLLRHEKEPARLPDGGEASGRIPWERRSVYFRFFTYVSNHSIISAGTVSTEALWEPPSRHP